MTIHPLPRIDHPRWLATGRPTNPATWTLDHIMTICDSNPAATPPDRSAPTDEPVAGCGPGWAKTAALVRVVVAPASRLIDRTVGGGPAVTDAWIGTDALGEYRPVQVIAAVLGLPVWDDDTGTYLDPDTRQPLTTWEEALDDLDADDQAQPRHTVRFGTQLDVKGVLAGSPEAERAIGYLVKYLTKDLGDDLTQPDDTADADDKKDGEAEDAGPASADRTRRADHIARLVDALRFEPSSPSRVRQSYRLLSQIFAAAVNNEMIIATPCRGVKLPRMPETEPHILTRAEVDRLISKLPEPHDLLVQFLAFGGLRIGTE